MSTEPVTPFSIGLKTFRIPLYQRPYAWEEPQTRQLLDDLYEAFKITPGDHYHIGILSVAETSDDKDRYDLIDGQQRITTLILIGMAASKHCPDWFKFRTPDRLDLYGRSGDQDFLQDERKTYSCNRNMLANFNVANEFFKNADAPEFARYIYEHAAFFLAEVPPGYSLMDKNQQFVRMNNRGKQLEKHEILMDRLIPLIQDTNAKDKAFSDWNEMVNSLTGLGHERNHDPQSLELILNKNTVGETGEPDSNEEEILSRSIISVPEFLLIALARYCRKDISHNTDKLIETFSEMLLNVDMVNLSDNISTFMGVLRRQLTLLQKFFIFVIVNKDGGYELGESYDNEDLSFDFNAAPDGKKRLIVVQSFLHVSTLPHHWLIPAFDWCSQFPGGKVGALAFVEKLEEIDNNLIQNQTRFLSPIRKLECMTYPSVSHYWFYRLDYELWRLFERNQWDDIGGRLISDDRIRKLVRDFRFRSCGSVEHIIPQNPIVAPQDSKADHSFGNLALISGSRNSKFSNSGIGDKRDLILTSDDTESLKMLHFLWCDSNAPSAGEVMHKILIEAVIRFLPPASSA